LVEAARRGCNPGGLPMGEIISPDKVPPSFRNRLLTKEEATTLAKGIQ
jgi:hypothetical protein